MKHCFISALMLLWMSSITAATPARKQLFDANWQFSKDSVQWRAVNLPHDWSIEGPFDKNTPAGNEGAYLPTGKGWYKKTFNIDNLSPRTELYFDGVYEHANIFINGQLAGHHDYGYTPFTVDATPFLTQGQNNVVVSVDNSQQKNCRWYSGSGIYRHVWLMNKGKRYIDEWSVCVTTPDIHTVNIKADVVMEDGSRKPIEKTLHVEQPHLWSPEDPYLYKTTIEAEGDVLPVTYGIRTIEYDAQNGFRLNGKTILINGACVHHDNGFLGAASFDAAEARKVKLMKEAGFNLLRTSHNPPSAAFLDACDSLGMLVIDEAFDGWRTQKTAHDFHTYFDAQAEKEIESMVRRDMNHPSIISWSLGNEVIERKDIRIVHTAKLLKQAILRVDTSRPVTEALCAWDRDWEIYDPHADVLDISGYNYMLHKHESDHRRVPNRVIWQTESYPADALKNWKVVSEYPYVIGDIVWTGLDYLGESGIGRWFYEGEVPGESWERPLYPWHASYCGDVDFTGLRKPISHYRSMLYNRDGEHLYMAVREPDGYFGKVKTTQWSTWPTFENWNWSGHEGKPIDVEVYSHYPKVRLYLNDKLVEEKAVEDCKVMFTLPYQSGKLRAEGIADNQVKESVSLQTAGEAKTIRLTTDHSKLKADGQDLAFITIEILDKDGRLNPTAANELTATVSGPATLAAFGNADIKDCDRYTDAVQKAWKGRALLVVRSTPKRGRVTVTVQGKGLKTGKINLN